MTLLNSLNLQNRTKTRDACASAAASPELPDVASSAFCAMGLNKKFNVCTNQYYVMLFGGVRKFS